MPASAAAQNIWDDPAFVLYRQGLGALDAKNYLKAATLARDATAAYLRMSAPAAKTGRRLSHSPYA